MTRRFFFTKMASPLHQADPPRPYDRKILYLSLISLICDNRRPSRLNAERARKGSEARTWGVAGGRQGRAMAHRIELNLSVRHRPRSLPSARPQRKGGALPGAPREESVEGKTFGGPLGSIE